MWRQPPPSNCASQTKLVKSFEIVIGNTLREDMPLPRIGWNFEPLQLPYDFESRAFALHLRSRRNVLPAQQPAHELRRRHRFDLFTEGCDCETVNAREQATIAPFVLRGRPRPRFSGCEITAQNRAARFQSQQGLFYIWRGNSKQLTERTRGRRTNMRHPSGNETKDG